jgi:hypothetical protein
MALETGGRLTQNTNDLALGVARAERDLECRYTVGFYDRNAKDDVRHEVVVRVNQPGLRVVHPSAYAFRSREARRWSLVKTAFTAPDMFTSNVVRAHVFPIRPEGKKSWTCLLAAEFPVVIAPSQEPSAIREFGITLSSGAKVYRSLSRKISLRALAAMTPQERKLSFLDEVELPPGQYTVTLVVTDPSLEKPMAAHVQAEVPPVPREKGFLVGPYLGTRAERDVVVQSAGYRARRRLESGREASLDRVGTPASFQPLLVQRMEERKDTIALTQVCSWKPRDGTRASVLRSLMQSTSDEVAGSLPDVVVTLEGGEPVSCQSLLDVIPTASMKNGQYVFKASVRSEHETAPSLVRFSLDRPGAKSGEESR